MESGLFYRRSQLVGERVTLSKEEGFVIKKELTFAFNGINFVVNCLCFIKPAQFLKSGGNHYEIIIS